MNPDACPKKRLARGFTLIEVLVAVTILSLGLLGLAALQIAGLQNGQQSYQRTQASALAYDIADRMRANRLNAITGASYPGGYSITPATLSGITGATTPSCAPSSTGTAVCTAAQLAAYDVSSWALKVKALTGGTASISCAGTCAAGQLQTVTVMWDEYRTGATDTSCPLSSAYNRNVNLACFTISFAP